MRIVIVMSPQPTISAVELDSISNLIRGIFENFEMQSVRGTCYLCRLRLQSIRETYQSISQYLSSDVKLLPIARRE